MSEINASFIAIISFDICSLSSYQPKKVVFVEKTVELLSSHPNKAYFGESLPPLYLPDDWILLQVTITFSIGDIIVIFLLLSVSPKYSNVENYCKAVSSIIHPLLEFYPYELSSDLAADETYIKVMGKIAYIFFYFDTIKKIVTSYRVFEKRDSLSSIKAAYQTLSKYDVLPDDLQVISDGNPIYNVAVQYWTEHNLPFKLYQVIGLTNQDDISKQYRSEKQIIERHNRTLKYHYRPKGGFSSLDNANSYMVLFATCFNFLRPHSALNYKVPVEIPELNRCSNMPNKWIELINLAYKYTDIYI